MPKFLRTTILKNICERVLLRIKCSFGKASSQTSLKPNVMDISFSTRSLVGFKIKLCYARFTIYIQVQVCFLNMILAFNLDLFSSLRNMSNSSSFSNFSNNGIGYLVAVGYCVITVFLM